MLFEWHLWSAVGTLLPRRDRRVECERSLEGASVRNKLILARRVVGDFTSNLVRDLPRTVLLVVRFTYRRAHEV